MEQAAIPQYSFDMLIDPQTVVAAAQRAAQWNLPRRICRPLDRRVSRPVSAEVAAFDATVEDAPVAEE